MATAFDTGSTALTSQFLNDVFQQALARWNHERLMPGLPSAATSPAWPPATA